MSVADYESKHARKRCLLMGAAIAMAIGAPAAASGTVAGTRINNTATATFSLPSGGSGSVTSNTVSLTVDELLNVAVSWSDGGDVSIQPGTSGDVLTFRLTNGGNGTEPFTLSARNSLSGDNFDPTSFSIYLDTNGNGRYDPTIDQAYVAGSNDPVLAADATTTAFLVATVPGGLADAARAGLDLLAVAKTGSGTPGTTFPGAGDGGVNAVVGATGANGFATGFYVVSAASVTFVKSATVVDPFGGTTSVPGSIISYRLVATVSGSGTLANLAVADTVPTGSSYRAGSITLDGSALTDATDGDAGEISGTALAVRLGNVAAGTSRAVAFKVVIQ